MLPKGSYEFTFFASFPYSLPHTNTPFIFGISTTNYINAWPHTKVSSSSCPCPGWCPMSPSPLPPTPYKRMSFVVYEMDVLINKMKSKSNNLRIYDFQMVPFYAGIGMYLLLTKDYASGYWLSGIGYATPAFLAIGDARRTVEVNYEFSARQEIIWFVTGYHFHFASVVLSTNHMSLLEKRTLLMYSI